MDYWRIKDKDPKGKEDEVVEVILASVRLRLMAHAGIRGLHGSCQMEQEDEEKDGEQLFIDLADRLVRGEVVLWVFPYCCVINQIEMVLFTLNSAPKDEVAAMRDSKVAGY